VLRLLRNILWDIGIFAVASTVLIYVGAYVRGFLIMGWVKAHDFFWPPSPSESADKVLKILAERREFISSRVREMAREKN
jgi:hypothetical protein